ncbi:hypothetical protein Aab01nite_70970 [Paractinoplanes abujensis]|uniref:Uncharacterized protein n=1 Tax=Paractinoplanes abujensis TaxID=882441 RepID=A0A7W7CYM4_9ACTN|nr:hypothetical protein [Actinoplanes abujensis]MBB4695915.1 hypothetical protein [Actinoplanes abujensis]GID23507.1 hypothetical protein Aab01nite_70970 [Actinoplanes abujensis]
MRTRAVALALAAAMSVVAVPAASQAAVPPLSAVLAADEWDQAEADKLFVQWLSVNEPRLAVRSAARGALQGGAEAIATFLITGWDAAILRAEQLRTRNLDFTKRMIRTHPLQYYPRVNAAGQRALVGTDEELAEFVNSGYAKALELDRKDIDDDEDQAEAIRQSDRDYVTLLSTEDPGAQVRAWAGRAVAPGTTDADVVEFFRYGWVSASGLDMQTFRTRLADEDRRWHLKSRQLVIDAQAAEKAARETAGEAQAQMREAAARAWALVGAQTGPARVAWADAEQVALRQADTWLLVSQAAGTSTSANWLTIAAASQDARADWETERANASAQAASWLTLYRQALAAEAALLEPVA